MARSDTGNLVIPVGGQVQIITGICNYLYCYDQTGLVVVELQRNNKVIETHTVERLLNLPRKDFDSFIVRNVHSAENTVRFFMGPGDYVPNADRSVVVIDDAVPPVVALADGTTINLTGSSVTVTSDIAAFLTPLDDVTVGAAATLIAAANADRLEIKIAIPDTETNGIRIGNNGVTATKGIYVAPGQTYVEQNTAAIYGIRDGAANVKVTIVESGKV